jgi:ribosomal protein S18 acetylase RimI-like enzyme
MPSRAATHDDIDRVVECLTLAFRDDPVWGVALARLDGSTSHHGAFWRSYVEGALRYSSVFTTDDVSAVSVWIPPGGSELSEDQEADVVRLVEASLEPASAQAMFELWERFGANHPHAEPHAYLSLLATHPDHRGRGIGQQLLAEHLDRLDADGVPAFLESTNPANDHRYERAGFRRIGGFTSVLDDAPISTMWRSSHGTWLSAEAG